MANNHIDLETKIQKNKPVASEEWVFDTSYTKIPHCKKCTEACNGCKICFFNTLKTDHNSSV